VTTPVPRVKEPHLAGRGYPAAPDALARSVGALLAVAGPPRPGTMAVLVPHGPLAQAGAVVAAGIAAVAGERRRVLVLAPSHFADFAGAVVLPMDAYRTPLGTVPLDVAAVAALVRPPHVRANPAAFMREPGIEAVLPFLQTAGVEGLVVPMLVGRLEPGEAAGLAATLRPLLDDGGLLVVSSDLVHYGRRFDFLPVPPDDPAAVVGALRALDDATLAHVVAADADAFAAHVVAAAPTICGRHAIEVALRALPPGTRGERLAWGTSLAPGADAAQVVSWAAVRFGP
jgi:AmmeMemoRadiSam system protein B